LQFLRIQTESDFIYEPAAPPLQADTANKKISAANPTITALLVV
jgi:hypothetical protein